MLTQDSSGAYSLGTQFREKSWTVFVVFHFGDSGIEVEEIDVKAPTREGALATAQAALERDYDQGGKIADVRENIPGVIYL